jgi:pSer/pThr/pTyr-binding forkhead associated (FHA) protein
VARFAFPPKINTTAMYEQALKRFRKSCGLSAPLVLTCEDPTRSGADYTDHLFNHPFILIGRTRSADLCLDNEKVSRRHTYLHAIAGRILVTDLHSRTKVYWEGEQAPRSRGWLDKSGFIQVGAHRIRWNNHNASENHRDALPASFTPPDPERSEAESVIPCALELPIRVCDSPSLWPVEGDLAMVGRSEECQLVLTDDSISRFHAALVPTPSGLWVVDLLAREGVHVNGMRVRWAWLADGDTLRMGRFTFILRYQTLPDQITREDVPLEAGATPEEHPGTELAVRTKPSNNGGRGLAVRPGGRPLAPVRAETSPLAVEPDTLVRSGAELLGSIPFPANPMAMWQQQMQLMESFHNDMILMVQMFVAMHKEHSTSVRHELDMVQQLTRELSALQARAEESRESENAGPTASSDHPSRNRGPVQAIDRKTKVKKPARDAPDERREHEPSPSEPTRGSRAAGSKIPSTGNSGRPLPKGTPAAANSQIHAQLTQRIAELQRERQGYWQRILSSINK